jgi:putative SOS response-associated peptidase YedK
MINARAETIQEKPAYRKPFLNQRCLVPAGGFYEWKKEGKTKQPYLIRRRDHSPIAFAGLWERWDDHGHQKPLETFTIITTAANELVQPIHERMPLILEPDDFEAWLSPGEPSAELRAAPKADLLEAVPISTWVNSPAHDDPRCIEPIVQT